MTTYSSQIAFSADTPGGAREIYVADADGTGGSPTNLTNDPARDTGPLWSPEGSQIAFLSDRTGSDQIFVVNVDGNGASPTNISNGPLGDDDDNWSWSPDGSQIVFASERDGSSEIYVVDADGSNLMRLTNTVAFNTSDHWGPVWSRHLTPAPPTPSVPALSAGRTLALILLMAGIAIAAIFHHQREKVR